MGASIRLGALYGAMFLVIGIMMPFWPVWLEAKGLSATEIGMTIAAGSVIRVFLSPLIARTADRTGERRRIIIIVTILAFIAFLPFALADDFITILILQAIFAGLLGPLMPMSESITMIGARTQGLDYGRIRLWGSLTFIVGASGIGFFLKGASTELIWTVIAVAMGAFVIVSLFVPDFRSEPAGPENTPLRQVLKDRTFLVFIVATACIQGSHGMYYTFGTIHWLAQGLDEGVIGLLWAWGVIAEVILFVFAKGAIRRVGPARLIALAGFACVVRWAAMPYIDGLWLLVPLQALHAFTFGAAHLGAVFFIADRMPDNVGATAQTVYALCVSGLGIGLISLLSGHLYAAYAGDGYAAMALIGGVGMVLAWSIRRRS